MCCFPLLSGWRCELVVRAQIWRALMVLGMNFHKMPSPRPPDPAFRKRISTTLSQKRGEIDLLFYTPPDYNHRPQAHTRPYPVVVNFHGGGFTLGRASDDARWADSVVRRVNAVVISVEYRLAPEHPFPTAVEDGVDAILYLMANSDELGIDPRRIATTGFSAGGNLAFTVALKLQDVLKNPPTGKPVHDSDDGDGALLKPSIVVTSSVKQTRVLSPIVAIAAWYPITDFATCTRPERRLKNARPEKNLPEYFTQLFDESYLYPLPELSLSNPYLSPGLAPVQMLRDLPDNIIIYTCEWDELRPEAEQLRDRLKNEAEKEVVYRKVAGVAHAWDRSPNPLKWDPAIDEIYAEVCAALKRAFDSAGHDL